MEKTWVDFKAVKNAVSIEAVLGRYAVKVYRVNKEHVRGKCPLPSHTSAVSKLSFIANTAKNVWSCKSESCVAAREGKTGGNVLDFVALMERCSIKEAAEKLASWFGVRAELPVAAASTMKEAPAKAAGPTPAPAVESPKEEGENPPLKFTLKGVDLAHPYLGDRGIAEGTAALFGAGFFPGNGLMKGRVVIPIENERGELVAYVGRAIGGGEPKYKFPPGFKKTLVLYNLVRALKAPDARRVVVVEGFFGTMKVHQAGFPCVVGLMGSTLSEAQEKLLSEHFREAVLLLDGDEAGREGTAQIAARLVHKVFVKALDLPDGKQPDSLSAEEVRGLLGNL